MANSTQVSSSFVASSWADLTVEPSLSTRLPLVLAVSCLLIFLLSALCGVLVAYDRVLATEKFVALLTSIVVATGIAWVGSFYWRATIPIAIGFTLLVVATNLPSGRASLIDMLGEPIVILLPLCAGWLVSFGTRDRGTTHLLLAGSCAAILIAGSFFFIVVGDFSSGIALLATLMSTAWLIVQQNGSLLWRQAHSRLANRLMLVLMLLLISVYCWSIASPTASATIAQWAPSTVSQRWQRYHEFLDIVADYPLTGSGLAVSGMVYSSYLFLVQVPFLSQAHNLYLQVGVEQGIAGVIGLIGLSFATLWGLQQTLARSRSSQRGLSPLYLLAVGTVGALTAALVNGLLDGGLYSGPFSMLLFVPFGVAWALYFASESQPAVPQDGYTLSQPSTHTSVSPTSIWLVASGLSLAAFAPFMLLVAVFFAMGGFAALYANAGAVAQTQAELAIYQWPKWPLQDLVRRTYPQKLEFAEHLYNTAVELDPDNVTAQWRLGEIELAQGDYESAERHLVHAHSLAPNQRAVRQLLGEIYAIQGKSKQAVQLWQKLDLSQNQLQLRLWWYEMIGDSERSRFFEETLRTYEQTTCCL